MKSTRVHSHLIYPPHGANVYFFDINTLFGAASRVCNNKTI